MKFFAETDVRRLLHWQPLIDSMEKALAEFSAGKVIQPVRNMITIEEGKRYLGIMPAVGKTAMGLKLVSFYPGNAGTSVPTHLGLIILSRPDKGEPLAVLDGRLITEMRTAAVSAAVTRCVAPARTPVLALLGSGVQAAAHLDALSCARSFDEVRVWSRSTDNARRFAEQHRIRAMADVESAVRDADVIVTATNAIEPFLKGAWVKPGALVNAVGSPRPTWRELDDQLMRQCALIVDSREAVQKESGDVILSGAPILAEVGELFAGTKGEASRWHYYGLQVGRDATVDLAAAALVYRLSMTARPAPAR